MRYPKPKDNTITLEWGKFEDGVDVGVTWGDGCSSRDSNLLLHAICKPRVSIGNVMEQSVIKELQDRGYDITTMKFSIKKLPINNMREIKCQ
jgi:hypothetical protein